jgi:competence protein ComGF
MHLRIAKDAKGDIHSHSQKETFNFERQAGAVLRRLEGTPALAG